MTVEIAVIVRMHPNSRQVGWAIRGGTALLRAAMYPPYMMPVAEYLALVHIEVPTVTLNSAAYFKSKATAKTWKSD